MTFLSATVFAFIERLTHAVPSTCVHASAARRYALYASYASMPHPRHKASTIRQQLLLPTQPACQRSGDRRASAQQPPTIRCAGDTYYFVHVCFFRFFGYRSSIDFWHAVHPSGYKRGKPRGPLRVNFMIQLGAHEFHGACCSLARAEVVALLAQSLTTAVFRPQNSPSD